MFTAITLNASDEIVSMFPTQTTHALAVQSAAGVKEIEDNVYICIVAKDGVSTNFVGHWTLMDSICPENPIEKSLIKQVYG